jgi:hypothetical protein
MRAGRGRLPAALLGAVLLGAVLTACTQLMPAPPAAGRPVVLAREDLAPGFIGFIGPKTQHAPPFLGTPGTNFYCLRSFLDRRTGEVTHQLYVSDSYFGPERGWNAARDSRSRALAFVPVSHDEITCDTGCSYVEEFAAALPEGELRANPNGLAVTFAARSGDEKTVLVSGERITTQLAAVDARRNPTQPVAAIGITPP